MSSFKIATVILSLIVVCMTGPWLEVSFKKCDFLLAEERKKIPTQLGSLFSKHIILLIASAIPWVNKLDHPVYMEASLVRVAGWIYLACVGMSNSQAWAYIELNFNGLWWWSNVVTKVETKDSMLSDDVAVYFKLRLKKPRAVPSAIIGGGGGVYSCIRVLPDGFLLKAICFYGMWTWIYEYPPPPPPPTIVASRNVPEETTIASSQNSISETLLDQF
jgi:hypothetical protein